VSKYPQYSFKPKKKVNFAQDEMMLLNNKRECMGCS